MAGGRMHSPHPTPLDPPLAISYKNDQKSVAYFSYLSSFSLKGRVKKREWGYGTMLLLNTLLKALHLFRDMIKMGKESPLLSALLIN